MFLANVMTIWVEALSSIFNDGNLDSDLRDIPILTEYPLEEINYPGIWVNFLVGGEVSNVGIDHREWTINEQTGRYHEVFRWKFGGNLEITVGAMGNLERALLVDKISAAIAVARIDDNLQGEIRRTVERNDLVGMAVVWESFTIAGMAETPGTPWQTDDVIYEATIMLTVVGEVVLDPYTPGLVPLSKIVVTPLLAGEPGSEVPAGQGWQ